MQRDALLRAPPQLPPGYSMIWSGQYEYMIRAQKRMMIVVPMTLVIIFLLLYLNFKNITESLIIMLSVPFSLTGGLWLMYLLGYNMSVAVGVGFIALAGVGVEMGVVLLVYLNQALSRHQDEAMRQERSFSLADLRSTVIEGALMRIRPIMMTVATVIVGLLPVMFGGGTGAEVMPVTAVDGRQIGEGKPGKTTQRLLAALRDRMGELERATREDLAAAREFFQADGIHPTKEGYEVIVEQILKVLKPILDGQVHKPKAAHKQS